MVDTLAIQYWVEKGLPNHGIDVEKVLQEIGLASNPDSADVALKTDDVVRAIQREQKLMTAYRDRAKFPHLRGGRPKLVANLVSMFDGTNKEQILRMAAKSLSPRSYYRVKKALKDKHKVSPFPARVAG